MIISTLDDAKEYLESTFGESSEQPTQKEINDKAREFADGFGLIILSYLGLDKSKNKFGLARNLEFIEKCHNKGIEEFSIEPDANFFTKKFISLYKNDIKKAFAKEYSNNYKDDVIEALENAGYTESDYGTDKTLPFQATCLAIDFLGWLWEEL